MKQLQRVRIHLFAALSLAQEAHAIMDECLKADTEYFTWNEWSAIGYAIENLNDAVELFKRKRKRRKDQS